MHLMHTLKKKPERNQNKIVPLRFKEEATGRKKQNKTPKRLL